MLGRLFRRFARRREPHVSELDSLKALLTKFEGCRLTAYKCPAGKYTIGVGATRTLGNRPVPEGMKISQAQADALLDRDAGKALEQARKVMRGDATPAARVAYASLIFNMGFTAIRKSEALRFYNEGDLSEAERHFKQWRGLWEGDKFRVLPGLVRRRNAEWKFIKETEQ